MILINGTPQQNLNCLDRGLQYGDGLFETIAFRNGELQYWPLHWSRFITGCERLFIPAPDEKKLRADIEKVTLGIGSAAIKILYTRGVGERGYAFSEVEPSCIIMRLPLPQYPKENSDEGVNLYLCQTRLARQPILAGIKHLNRLENVLARHEWSNTNYAEGLLCDMEGNVIEGTMSNIFIVKNGKLRTPELSQCGVKGVTRARIFQFAADKNIYLIENEIPLKDIYDADEVFICNSLIGIWPVNKIGDQHFLTEKNANPITRQLQQALYSS